MTVLARALHALEVDGDLATSRVRFDAAFRAAQAADDPQQVGLAALGFGGMWVHEQRSTTAAALVEGRLRHALSVVDPGSTLALRLRIRLAAELDYRAGTSDAVLALLDEARRNGDAVAVAEALSLVHHCLLGPEHGGHRLSLSRDLIAQSLVTGRRSDQLTGLLWHTVDLLMAAHPHAERSLAELQAELARADHLAIRFVERAVAVMLRLREGAFAEAEALALACAEQGHRAGDADVTGWYGAHLIAIRWFQGRSAELIPLLAHQVNSPTLSAVDNSHLAALAAVCAMSGDRRQATAALARLTPAGLPRSSSWLVTMYGAVEAAFFLGDADTAAAAYRQLAPFEHLPMVASLGVACFGSTHHALGVAALTTGDTDAAVRHLRAAVRDNWALGHFPAVALSRSRLAQALARSGARAEALRVARAARQEADGLGMVLPPDDVARPAAPRPATCRRHGARWRIELGDRAAVVADSVGMSYLALLTANPGVEISAVELAVGRGVLDRVAGGVTAEQAATSAQPVLDEVARHAYQRRLATLQSEIDTHERGNDLARAELLRSERDWLIDELATTTGLRGQGRDFTDNAERARVSVGKAIRRALDQIAKCDPAIATVLRTAIATGTRCSYRP